MADRSIADSVFVITGASSGIGRATALELASRGASIALAARRQSALEDVAAECRRRGARAFAMPLDVVDRGRVDELATRAVEELGRIDCWVNNAAVTLFGRLTDTPPDAFQRVLETNIFGYVNGSRAAMDVFQRQRTGVLVNVSSVVALSSQPYTAAYTMSKHAVRALGASLRQELQLEHDHDIRVCTVLPATIDTPLFQQAANFTGRAIQAMSPVYPPEKVARTIVELAMSPRREVFVGRAGRALAALAGITPALVERLMARMVNRNHFQDAPAPTTQGNLWEPMPAFGVMEGGWRREPEVAREQARREGMRMPHPSA